jgi:hypothetical protein
MSKKLTLLLLFCTVVFFPVQAQSWLWAKSVNQYTKLSAAGADIDLDPSGNIFITGRFVADSMTFGNVTITNNGIGHVDAYIAKYDPFGNAVWAKSIGGNSSEEGAEVATDLYGNVYATGYFASTIIIGNETLVNSSGGLFDIYLIKFDGAGNVLWAKRAGGVKFDYGYGVATDAAGNAYLTGAFCSDSITFGNTTLLNTSTGGYGDAFITKYDPNGNVIWAKRAGGTGYDESHSITVAQSGEIFITGNYQSWVMNFDSSTITKVGNQNIFLAKYDSSGNPLFVQSAGGAYSESSHCVTTDMFGNAYVTGSFNSTVCTFGNTTLNCAGGEDFFLAKYDSTGNVAWAKRAGGSNGTDIGYSVATDPAGNVYATGVFFSSQVILGADTFPAPASSRSPMFIARYDQNGNTYCHSVLASGGSAVATDASGNAYMTGSFNITPFIVGLDTLHLSTPFNSGQGGADIFIAKYNCDYNPKGIAEPGANEEIIIYPNPGNGVFQVTMAGSHNGQNSIEVYDVHGKLISVNLIQNNTAEVNISSHPQGLYFIRYVSMDKIFTAKIIKQ